MKKHGGDIYTAKELLQTDELLDFSANINPFGVSASVRRAIENSIQELVHYPDPYCRSLRQALAQYHNVKPEHIVCGNGGADIIFRFVRAASPSRAIVPVPTFSEYGQALEECGCKVNYFEMPKPFQLTDALEQEISDGAYDFLALCNPNNPTGSLIEPGLLYKILDTAKQRKITVLLDECFLDMAGDGYSMIAKTSSYPNLFILKSMTKLYALPGLRLGYGICADSEMVERVRNTGQPWSVSTPASAAGCAALQDEEYRLKFLTFLKEERQYLYNGLRRLGFRVWEPHANYIFFSAQGCVDLDKRLLKNRILLRHCDNYQGLDAEYYRAAVRTHSENEILLSCLQEIIGERSAF